MTCTEDDSLSITPHSWFMPSFTQIPLVIALCLAGSTLFIYWDENEFVFPGLVAVGVAYGGRPACCALALAASKTFLSLGIVLLSMRELRPGWWFDFSYLRPSLCSLALDSAIFIVVGYLFYIVWHAAIRRDPARIRQIACLADVYWLAFFCTIVPVAIVLGIVVERDSRLLRQQYTETRALTFARLCELANNPEESLRRRSLALLTLPEKSRGVTVEEAKQVATQVLKSQGDQGPLARAAHISLAALEINAMTSDAVSPFDYLDGWTYFDLNEQRFYENVRTLALTEGGS